MNIDRIKPETLAAGVMDLTPSQSLAAHEYAERLNAALARLGLTDRLTLPPAPNTAIDELPAVVDVPLRKTLSVLMGKAQQGDASALATLEWTAQVAESIFAGLHARDFAGDRPLALPSHESLATLSQGVDALLPRKISTGWSVASLLADPTCDGIDDGVSLVRLFCTDAIDSVTELKDDNEGWVMTKSLTTSATKVTLNCVAATANVVRNNNTIEELHIPYLESVPTANGSYLFDKLTALKYFYAPKLKQLSSGLSNNLSGLTNCKYIDMPELTDMWNGYGSITMSNCPVLKWINIPKFDTMQNVTQQAYICNNPELERVVMGKFVLFQIRDNRNDAIFYNCPKLVHLEIGQGTAVSLRLTGWSPTSVLSDSERLPIFLSNFKTYIAERLSELGSGKTLTLSQAVRDAIEGDPTIAQIITSKGWTISPAPSV